MKRKLREVKTGSEFITLLTMRQSIIGGEISGDHGQQLKVAVMVYLFSYRQKVHPGDWESQIADSLFCL